MKDTHLSKNDLIPFSEALEKTGYGLFNYAIIFLGGLLMSCTLYETASIGFVLPIAECDLKLTNEDKGLLSSIVFIGIIVSSHLWGFLADTKGRRAVIMPSLLIASVLSIVSSFSNRFELLICLRFLNGFFIAASFATAFVYVGEFHNDRTRTRSIMAASVIFSIGSMLLPLLSWAIINQKWALPLPFLGIVYKPWRLLILICGCIGSVSWALFVVLPESPKFLMSVGKTEEAISVIKKMHKWNFQSGDLEIKGLIPEKDTIVNTANGPELTNSSLLRAFLNTVWNQTMPLFQKGLLLYTVIICTIQFWMYVTIHGMFMWYPFITDIMVSYIGENSGNSSTVCEVVHKNHLIKTSEVNSCTEELHDATFLYSIIMEFCFGLGFVVIGALARKVKKEHMLFFILFAFGACGVWIIFIRDSTLALIVFNTFFLSGVGVSLLNGITIELYPTHLRAMALCISLMFGRLGGVTGANIAGWLLADNCEMTFYISGVGMIGSGFLAFLLPTTKIANNVENIEL